MSWKECWNVMMNRASGRPEEQLLQALGQQVFMVAAVMIAIICVVWADLAMKRADRKARQEFGEWLRQQQLTEEDQQW